MRSETDEARSPGLYSFVQGRFSPQSRNTGIIRVFRRRASGNSLQFRRSHCMAALSETAHL
jgi:hypothetical protein